MLALSFTLSEKHCSDLFFKTTRELLKKAELKPQR